MHLTTYKYQDAVVATHELKNLEKEFKKHTNELTVSYSKQKSNNFEQAQKNCKAYCIKNEYAKVKKTNVSKGGSLTNPIPTICKNNVQKNIMKKSLLISKLLF